jgi:hypothetical protein
MDLCNGWLVSTMFQGTTMKIKDGSRWEGNDAKFIVLHEIETDGHEWIHYRDEKGDPPREYSCYKESFLQRFRQLPE